MSRKTRTIEATNTAKGSVAKSNQMIARFQRALNSNVRNLEAAEQLRLAEALLQRIESELAVASAALELSSNTLPKMRS